MLAHFNCPIELLNHLHVARVDSNSSKEFQRISNYRQAAIEDEAFLSQSKPRVKSDSERSLRERGHGREESAGTHLVGSSGQLWRGDGQGVSAAELRTLRR